MTETQRFTVVLFYSFLALFALSFGLGMGFWPSPYGAINWEAIGWALFAGVAAVPLWKMLTGLVEWEGPGGKLTIGGTTAVTILTFGALAYGVGAGAGGLAGIGKAAGVLTSPAVGTPNPPVVDATVYRDQGDSLWVDGGTFAGSGGDTHSATIIQIDTTGGTFNPPKYHADTLGAIERDSIGGNLAALDSGAVVDIIMIYEGASGGESDPDTLTGVSMVSSTAFFSDGFESGDLTHTEGGVSWTTSEYSNSGAAMGVRENEEAHTGTHALLFYYNGGTAECRFNLGAAYDEIWVEWYVWIPADWEHPAGSPSNDKFFFLWGGDYNHEGAPKAGMEFLADADTGPESNLRIMYDPAGDPATRTVPDGDIVNWIGGNGVMVRGAWNQMRVHINIGTGSTIQTDGHATGDGIYEVWSNSSLIYRNTNLGFMPEPLATYPYWDVGYFFGSSSSDPVDVSFYIDDVSFYNSDPGW